MNRYWENGSGYYDPTAKQAIDSDGKREKVIRDVIYEIKLMLHARNLSLEKRIVIKDEKTGKIYR